MTATPVSTATPSLFASARALCASRDVSFRLVSSGFASGSTLHTAGDVQAQAAQLEGRGAGSGKARGMPFVTAAGWSGGRAPLDHSDGVGQPTLLTRTRSSAE